MSCLMKYVSYMSYIRITYVMSCEICLLHVLHTALQSPLLVRNPHSRNFYVNFNARLFRVIREVECMRSLRLQVPHCAQLLSITHESLFSKYFRLTAALADSRNIRKSVPNVFAALTASIFNRVSSFLRSFWSSIEGRMS